MGNRKNYTDDDFIIAVKESKSIAGVLKKLGLIVAGGNYSTVKRKIQILNLNTSHFTGMLWSKGDRLKDWSHYTRAYGLKKHLIIERGNICEKCGLTEWLGNDIILELHHIDGDKTNNDLKNLILLCPNCHSYTKGWRRTKETPS